MDDLHRTLIVPVATVAASRAFAKGLEPTKGDNMWPCKLSPTGELPATHYASSGYISKTTADMLPCKSWKQQDDNKGNQSWHSQDVNVPDTANLAGKLKSPKATLDAILNAADVSDQPPFEAFARLGLKIIGDRA